MNWKMIDKDVVAENDENVFRIKREVIEKKSENRQPNLFTIYQLEVRKKGNVTFKKLGYEFLFGNVPSDYEGVRLAVTLLSRSVQGVFWTDINSVVDEAEEILIGLGLVRTFEFTYSTISEEDKDKIFEHVKSAFLESLKFADYVSHLDGRDLDRLGEMLICGARTLVKKEIAELYGEEGELDAQQLKSFESLLTSFMMGNIAQSKNFQ